MSDHPNADRRPQHPAPALVPPVAAAAAVADALVIDDWNLLYAAVLCRLRATVSAGADAAGVPEVTAATVLDCVAALEQLKSQLDRERAGRKMSSVALAAPDEQQQVRSAVGSARSFRR